VLVLVEVRMTVVMPMSAMTVPPGAMVVMQVDPDQAGAEQHEQRARGAADDQMPEAGEHRRRV